MWDFNPNVGLIVAGGNDPISWNMNISRDHGKSIETLTNIPSQYSCSGTPRIYGGCVVIVNKTTIFAAGGRGE